MIGFAVRAVKITLAQKYELERKESMLLLKVMASTTSTKLKPPLMPLIVLLRLWGRYANMLICIVVTTSVRW